MGQDGVNEVQDPAPAPATASDCSQGGKRVLTDKNGGKGTGTKTKLRDGDEGIVPLLDALYLLAVELIIL